ncbi:MAG: hypothetical protein ACRDJJ_06135 [Actinomycetota bacterium]
MEGRGFLDDHETDEAPRLRAVSREANRKSQSLVSLLGALFYAALIAATLYLLVRVSF